ncbi:MAG: Gfo/Idh/MocA family oxidoreductase [Alphaproteobacteria bacterium]|nr:Gfo/Idh/MocA family oxidoreductase [Alphaproteobacteria bacterium]
MTARAAIIGLGRWGRSLVNAVHDKTDAIRFTAAYTRTRANAEDFCREKSIPLLARFEDALADPNIDAVVLATPHSQHAEQVMAAAAAGKHIHAEKPLTLDRPSAEAAVAAARRAGIVLAVGFNRRFHPSVVAIRKRLAGGQLGQVMSMVATHTTSTGQFIAADNWRAQPDEAPGGAITAVGVHSIDHMIEFGGEVADVLCTTRRYIPGPPADDTTNVMLRFKNGATGLLFCSVATATTLSFTLFGTKGLAEFSKPNLGHLRFVPVSTVAPTGPVTAPPDEIIETPTFDMLHAELVEFGRCIEAKRPYPVAIDQVLHGMAVFDAVIRSGKSGNIEAVDGSGTI